MNRLTAVILIFIMVGILFVTGCGGGGGSNDDSAATLQPGLCAGFKYQGSEKKNIIFAAVNRSGITGHIETTTGAKLPGSDLVSNSQANTSEVMLENATIGTYKFVYFVNSERFEISKDISWTTIADFSAVPADPTWTTNSMLSVTYSAVNAGNVNYYLRLFYSYSPNTMYQQTSTSPGGGVLSMNVNTTGNFIPVLVADVIENDQLASTVRYFFAEVSR